MIAAARIDWIQSVRKITAELITLVNKCLTPIDKDNLLEVTLQAKEKIELLILYFGNKNINPDKNVCLDKTTDNKGKNKEIVNFLSSLSKQLTTYFEMIKNEELENLKKIQERRLSEMQNYTISWDYYEDEDDYGNIYQTADPILDKEYEESLNNIKNEISKIEQQSINLEKDTIRLREIIRLYLKIEWAKAKTGS